MIFSTTIFNLLARTLATILYIPPNKANRSKLLNVNGLFLQSTSSVKIMEAIHDVSFKHIPASLKKKLIPASLKKKLIVNH
jgi:hypothetical protein